MAMYANAKKTLKQLKNQGRYRKLTLPCGLDLSSNDYLGMAEHPALREAALAYFDQTGFGVVGAGGSRLLRGNTAAHEELEAFAAEIFGSKRTLFFSSGFQANYAILTTLPVRGDLVLYDEHVHASMRDGLSASCAKSFKFSHNDMNALETLLKGNRDKAENIWVCAESVYSMDGDQAPISALFQLAERYDVMLIIDEAHATGVHGQGGRGLAYDVIIKNSGYDHLITLHTCGKAIGVAGAIICAREDIIEYMINTSRPFIFSTAPMPVQAVLVHKSLGIILSTDGECRRKKLLDVCRYTQQLLGDEVSHGGHIVPLILGEDKLAVEVAERLQKQGFDIRAIRPPSVPQGTSRLRLSLSSKLDLENIVAFVSAYKSAIN
jgi:8-amino-7-oxononanoate synthase